MLPIRHVFKKLPWMMAVITSPRKLNITPYPYRNKFCKDGDQDDN